jgi:radical SAM protein with 4Fe4S-binding SPASM domain
MFDQQDFYAFVREVNRLRQEFPEVAFSTTIDLMDPDCTTSHDLIVQKKTTCAAGVEACVIGPLGHVYGCSYSPASFPDEIDAASAGFIAGNIRDDPLATVWRDSSRWQIFRKLDEVKNPKCLTCSYYQTRCSGSCQIMSFFEMKHQNSGLQRNGIAEFLDPYCFVDLLPDSPRER